MEHESPQLESPERRAFTLQSILAVLSGVTITITACGGDSSPSSPSPTQGNVTGNVSGSISANHGHTAVITAAQLTATSAVVLQIRGTATHPHSVELSAQELNQVSARQRVSKTSSTDDSPDAGRHGHTITFN